MICWPGDEMHDGLRQWPDGIRQERVVEADRCVNEGAEGCAVRAGENGWCDPCWRAIVPA